MRDENQLHAAVVELVALDDAEIKYSTVQNWYPGDAEGKGGIYNFVTKRGDVRAATARKVSWTQVETGIGDHLEISVLHPEGREQRRRILFGRGDQQSPAGRYRHQDDPYRRQQPLDDRLEGHQRRPVEQHLSRPGPGQWRRRECPQLHPVRFSLLLGDQCGAHTVPYIEVRNPTAQIEHEATTSKISDDQLFYAMQRGLSQEDAVALIVNGFAREVLQQLPMEFAVEAQKLLGISLEGSVG